MRSFEVSEVAMRRLQDQMKYLRNDERAAQATIEQLKFEAETRQNQMKTLTTENKELREKVEE